MVETYQHDLAENTFKVTLPLLFFDILSND